MEEKGIKFWILGITAIVAIVGILGLFALNGSLAKMSGAAVATAPAVEPPAAEKVTGQPCQEIGGRCSVGERFIAHPIGRELCGATSADGHPSLQEGWYCVSSKSSATGYCAAGCVGPSDNGGTPGNCIERSACTQPAAADPKCLYGSCGGGKCICAPATVAPAAPAAK